MAPGTLLEPPQPQHAVTNIEALSIWMDITDASENVELR
eukprot:CAMPEP_0197713066 /NCGR_PEP_ID=MMETSP1338-20131121/130274_1 /TAXON_ID=43686 ORGANISM="Pelagodinium beii, Strain RCC1491" /NCGR_SAMPLE_ID=MMETSP1338 /ASSEMBLY_ACC=CAM_ASM_000754 /LENGTH=38 /DNA_ID= /DNA_START= /DNA_END= /DNA_ORIENTATION=